MNEAAQLLEMKRLMDEEHRKDREALERLMRFIPKVGTAPPTGNNVEPISREVNKADKNALTDLDHKIVELISAQPEKNWPVRDMIEGVTATGFELNAARPETTINRSIRRLLAHGLVICIREPLGRRAGLYSVKSGGAHIHMKEAS